VRAALKSKSFATRAEQIVKHNIFFFML